MTALRHDQAILDEQEQANVRVISESTRPGERPYPLPMGVQLAEARARAERPNPRQIAATIAAERSVEDYVKAAFIAALDGDTIDPRFATQETAIAAIESMAMEQYQRPLTHRDALWLGCAVVLEWNRRYPEQLAESRRRADTYETTRPRVVTVLP